MLKLRFSLLTLLLLSLWLGLAGVVYLRREPWEFETQIVENFKGKTFSEWWELEPSFDLDWLQFPVTSPDKSRRVQNDLRGTPAVISGGIEIIDVEESRQLFHIGQRWPDSTTLAIGFSDNDTLLFISSLDGLQSGTAGSSGFRVAHRRFPEWWWGHFYRPEVWALIVLTIAIIVLKLRSRTQSHAPAMAEST